MLFKKIKSKLPEKKECLYIKLFDKNIFLKKEFDSSIKEREKEIEKKEKQLLNKKRKFKEKKVEKKNFEKISKKFVKKMKKENEKKEIDEFCKKYKIKSDKNGLCCLPIKVGELKKTYNIMIKKINTLMDDKIRIKKPFSEKKKELFKRIKLLSRNQIIEIIQLLNINKDDGVEFLTIDDIKKKNYGLLKKRIEEFEKINKNAPNFISFEEFEKENENKKKKIQKSIHDNNIILNDSQISESISDEEKCEKNKEI